MTTPMHLQMPGRLVFGNGATQELPELMRGLGVSRPLVVTDPGLVEAGTWGRVKGVLEAAGVARAVFDGVEPDPCVETAYACRDAARAGGHDVLVGLGGGSSLDIAKVAAVMMTNDGDVAGYVGIDRVPGPGTPTILVPTTAGTGSEVTPIAVLSDTKEHLKKGIVSSHLYATVALVDPELAVTCPPRVTAFTGVDTLVHAIEAYTNKFARPFVDALALECMRLVGRHLRRAVACGDDLDARYGMALACLFGGMCLGPVNTAAVHALAYPLGGTYEVPHGVANSLLLPYVMAFNRAADPEKFAAIARALGESTDGLAPDDAAALSASAVVRLSGDIGIVSRLRDLDIPEDGIDAMAEGAMKVTRLLKNNPKPVTLEDAKQIYRNAY